LDDYVLYSGLTLLLLAFFEMFQCYQRQSHIASLRSLRPSIQEIWTMREGVACKVPSSLLVPGDIILLTPQRLVMVDGVVIAGEAILDESSLTGESSPQRKVEGEEVFSGTNCLSSNFSTLTNTVPKAVRSAGLCVLRVTKTGFGTSQGSLIQSITVSSSSMSSSASHPDTFPLMMVLILLAILSCCLYYYLFFNVLIDLI